MVKYAPRKVYIRESGGYVELSYEVIAGQRRVRASELAGINTVPAFVLPLDRDRNSWELPPLMAISKTLPTTTIC